MPGLRWVALAMIGLTALARPVGAETPAEIGIAYLGLAVKRSLPTTPMNPSTPLVPVVSLSPCSIVPRWRVGTGATIAR